MLAAVAGFNSTGGSHFLPTMASHSVSLRLFPPKFGGNPNPNFISPNGPFFLRRPIWSQRVLTGRFQQYLSDPPSSGNGDAASLLPAALGEIVALFRSAGDDQRAKYQQLLHYGSKLPLMDPRFKNEEHRVQGCVSQVWVRAFRDPSDASLVRYDADSDSALTKGLAALLVFGLSGSPASAIAAVPLDFVSLLGLRQSLTPSRNNGFLNMLLLMQKKARELADHGGMTRGDRIRSLLGNALAPAELAVEDVSHLHAGHSGSSGEGETHFRLRIVSEEFKGKSDVKRHRLVYGLLQDELQGGLHSLSIVAKTPSEISL